MEHTNLKRKEDFELTHVHKWCTAVHMVKERKLESAIKIRISKEMEAALARIAARRSSNSSQVARQALVEFLRQAGK
jgi:hypothetical protein